MGREDHLDGRGHLKPPICQGARAGCASSTSLDAQRLWTGPCLRFLDGSTWFKQFNQMATFCCQSLPAFLHPPGICELTSYRWLRICTNHAGMMPSIRTYQNISPLIIISHPAFLHFFGGRVLFRAWACASHVLSRAMTSKDDRSETPCRGAAPGHEWHQPTSSARRTQNFPASVDD